MIPIITLPRNCTTFDVDQAKRILRSLHDDDTCGIVLSEDWHLGYIDQYGLKCEYCGSTYKDLISHCKSCGAPLPYGGWICY
jgi:hypothetical protein